MVHDHIPRREYYPELEKFNYTTHEYYRYHNAYVTSYDEHEMVRIFADAALAYDEDEMGDFTVSFRCADGNLASYVLDMLSANGKIFEIVKKAKENVAKENKKAARLLECESLSQMCNEKTGVVTYFIRSAKKKKDKDKNKK